MEIRTSISTALVREVLLGLRIRANGSTRQNSLDARNPSRSATFSRTIDVIRRHRVLHRPNDALQQRTDQDREVQRVEGVTAGRFAGAIAAWIAIAIACALPYAVLMFAAVVEGEDSPGQPLCPTGLCWAEAASPIGLFLLTAALSGSLTWFVCGSILHNGNGRPSKRLVALFPVSHVLVAMIPLGYVLVMLARPR